MVVVDRLLFTVNVIDEPFSFYQVRFSEVPVKLENPFEAALQAVHCEAPQAHRESSARAQKRAATRWREGKTRAANTPVSLFLPEMALPVKSSSAAKRCLGSL